MIGVAIVTHGGLARELIRAAEHVVGPQENWTAIGIGADDPLDVARATVKEGVHRVDTGAGVLVLTDMFGGTPANLAVSLLHRGRIEVLAGVNLPMLITIAEARDDRTVDLTNLAQSAAQAGRKYIAVASKIARGVSP